MNNGTYVPHRVPWIGNERVFHGACRDLRGVEGITVTNFVEASTYPATVFGLDGAGQTLFLVQNTAVGTETCNVVGVPAVFGNLTLEPVLGAAGSTCSAAGVTSILYSLVDGAGTVVSSASSDCSTALQQGMLLPNLDLGSYTLGSIEGLGSDGSTLFAACGVPVDHVLAGETVPVTLQSGIVCQ